MDSAFRFWVMLLDITQNLIFFRCREKVRIAFLSSSIEFSSFSLCLCWGYCVHTQNSPSYSSFTYIMSICGDHSFCNCNDKKRRIILKLECFSTLLWIASWTIMSKSISMGRSVSFHTQRIAFQPTQSQQTLKIEYTEYMCPPYRLAQNLFAGMRFTPKYYSTLWEASS